MTLKDPNPPAIFGLGLDNRLDFCRELIGSGEKPTASERREAAGLKLVVFDALAKAIESGVPKSAALLWADHDLGEGALLRGRAMSLSVAVALERQGINGASELSLAGAADAWAAITKINAQYGSVRLTYNFADPVAHKENVRTQLQAILGKCQDAGKQLIIELAPHSTPTQLEEAGGTLTASLHTQLLVEGMRELQDAGIEPAIWVVNPPSDLLAAATVAAQAYVDGRSNVRVLFQVGAEPDPGRTTAALSRLDRALTKLAARTTGVSGIVAGPDAFFGVLNRLHHGSVTREDAVEAISAHFKKLWDVYSEANKTSGVV